MSTHNDQASKLRQLVESKHSRLKPTRIIGVASGKGGTGKSFFSVNLSIALQRLGKRALLIDADFGMANVDIMLGVSPKAGLPDIISGSMKASEALQEGIEGVRYLSGGSGMAELLDMDSTKLQDVMASLLELEAEADIIILDLGAGANSVIQSILLACDEIIIVTTPEPTAVMDAYALVKTLTLRSEKLPALRLVVNRVENKREAADTPGAIISLARTSLNISIDQLGTIAFDPAVPAAIKCQSPLLVSHPGSAAAKNIREIAAGLIGDGSENLNKGGLFAFIQKYITSKNAAGGQANGS